MHPIPRGRTRTALYAFCGTTQRRIFQRLQFSRMDRWDLIPTMLISMSDTPCRDYVHFLEGVERSCLYLRLLPPLSTAHFLSARAVQGQPISPIWTSCATTYRISILTPYLFSRDCRYGSRRFYRDCHSLPPIRPASGFYRLFLDSMDRRNDSSNLLYTWYIGKF